MKLGKYIPLGFYQNVKIGYGTVDCRNLKTIYIKLSSWLSPEFDEDFVRIIDRTRCRIKTHLYNTTNDFFRKESIVDIDIRTNGIKAEKKSFMNTEITLYAKEQFDIKDEKIKKFVRELCENVIIDKFSDKKLFNFNKNKK